MCDDLDATMSELPARGVRRTDIAESRSGRLNRVRLTGGGDAGIYELRHPCWLKVSAVLTLTVT